MKNRQQNNKKMSASTMAAVALMAAVLCVLAPFSIPIGVIPVSLATLGLYFAVLLLGEKKALMVCALYLLIGFIGIPVFSGFSGGPAKLLGPTGGYLIGYLLLTRIAGRIVDKFPKNRGSCLLGFFLGTAACYFVGTIWLAFQMKISLKAAVMAGVVPFLAGDAVKIGLAVWIGPKICDAVRKTSRQTAGIF